MATLPYPPSASPGPRTGPAHGLFMPGPNDRRARGHLDDLALQALGLAVCGMDRPRLAFAEVAKAISRFEPVYMILSLVPSCWTRPPPCAATP